MRTTIAGLALRAAIGLCLTAISPPRVLFAQGVASEGPRGGSSAEPIELSANRTTAWSEGKVRWVQLEGQVAVLQGLEGPRGDRAIVRILPASETGDSSTKVDAYIESDAVPRVGFSKGKPASNARVHLESTYGVDLKPYHKQNIRQLSAAPADTRLLERGFPRQPDPGTQKSEHAQAKRRVKPAVDERSQRAIKPSSARIAGETSMVKPAPPSTEPAVDPPRIEPGISSEQPKSDPSVQKTQADLGDELPQELLDSLQDPPAPGSVLPRPSRPAEAIPVEDAPPGPLDDVEIVPLPRPIADPDFADATPIAPGHRQVLNIYQIDSDGFTSRQLESADGITKVVIRGGVNIVVETGVKPMEDPGRAAKREKEREQELKDAARLGLVPSDEPKQDPKLGTIDIVAENAVIWYKPEEGDAQPGGGVGVKKQTPLQIYVEGNVVFRQDDRKIAGVADRRTFRATRAFYDFQQDRLIALDGEASVFSPGVVSPMRISAPRIDQFPSDRLSSTGQPLKTIRADNTTTTGSRFADPGYQFTSRYMEANQIEVPATDPSTGLPLTNPDGTPVKRLKTVVDGRQNIFYMGGLPVFFWPYQEADEDDLSPSLREITPGYINYFGQFLLTDWNGFRVLSDLFPGLNIQKPSSVDIWNLEMDELSKRGVAFGTNIGYFGERLIPGYADGYSGYFKIWGLNDNGIDTLGTGPAVVTYGPPGLGKRGFQRGDVPLQQSFRGMTTFRHMQSFVNNKTGTSSFADKLPAYRIIDADTPTLLDIPTDPLEDLRLQLEFGLISDRNFQEEYYQNEWNTGRDQSTDLYLIRQLENRAATVLVEGNLQNFYTQTQWLPRLDYYRLGDSFLGDRFTYFQHSGADYAATHTAIEVNNPNIFAFMPYDPVSNTSGLFQSGRLYTAHEIDMPINLKYLRIVPYAQGQFAGWNNQIGGESMARIWGAFGARADILVWKKYGDVESDLFNVHGINHKIDFYADYRNAFSNQNLNQIGVQDTIDDNTYEFVRRYFALTNYAGGLLPMQYDPRFLLLRRMTSPITGTNDIQGTIQGVQLGMHQRLQTKRGPIGKRRIIDWMELDLQTTYFPNASRDNFGKSFGQNMYSWEWYIGDRTSFISYGWFEFFDITGKPLLKTNPNHSNNPFGINVITNGISIDRPPKGKLFLGYTIIDTGPISTSALNLSYSYWMSPKWYSTFSTVTTSATAYRWARCSLSRELVPTS